MRALQRVSVLSNQVYNHVGILDTVANGLVVVQVESLPWLDGRCQPAMYGEVDLAEVAHHLYRLDVIIVSAMRHHQLCAHAAYRQDNYWDYDAPARRYQDD